jgi:hypothetical protein
MFHAQRERGRTSADLEHDASVGVCRQLTLLRAGNDGIARV